MRVAIVGQQDFGKAVLEAFLARGDQVAGVFCAPEKPGAKADVLRTFAQEKQIKVFQFPSLKSDEAKAALKGLDVEIGIMAFVLQFAPQEFVNIPKHGTIQYHPSLLPKYRGPSSINWPIIRGETRTGLSIFWPDRGLDTGPILLQREVEILDTDTLGSLYFDRLYPQGVTALLEGVDLVRAGTAPKIPQDETQATYEGWCKQEDVQIDWQKPLQEIWNLIRGADPQPGAWTLHEGTTVLLHDAKKIVGSTTGRPGEVLAVDDAGMTIAASGGQIQVTRVRPEGGQRVSAAAFAKSVGLRPGVRLGAS